MKTNRQLANTVNMCAKIRMLVGSDDDSDNNRNNAHASNDKSSWFQIINQNLSYIICVALIFIRNNHCTVGDGHSGGGGEFGGEGGRGAVICGFVLL